MDNGRTWTGRWRKKPGWSHTDPDRVLPLGRSKDLDLYDVGDEGSDLLLDTISDSGVHGGATRQDNVGIQVLHDFDIALHDGVEGGPWSRECQPTQDQRT